VKPKPNANFKIIGARLNLSQFIECVNLRKAFLPWLHVSILDDDDVAGLRERKRGELV
jgi:hypothetical protein